VSLKLILSSLSPSSCSFDTSVSDRGIGGGGGSADEAPHDVVSSFRFPPSPLQSTATVIRSAASAEEKSSGPDVQGAYRVAFGHWGGVGGEEEMQQERDGARDDDIPFEVIGGW
jgi:hypothetical protein